MSCSPKYRRMFMNTAWEASRQSYATRLKVGCVVVRDDRPLALSYNGTPRGCDNCCEHHHEDGTTSTKDEVLHAEQNAIIQMATCNESISGSTMFVTHAPCMQCAKMIVQAGIKELFFEQEYRIMDGVSFLLRNKVIVVKMPSKYEEQLCLSE